MIDNIDVIFPSMANILDRKESTSFLLEKYNLSKDEVEIMIFRDIINGRREYKGLSLGEYIRLIDKNKKEIIMSDTPMEKRTNIEFYRNANGKVLIGGLGIGMILLAVQKKPQIDKIVVVEKHKEIIDIVASQLPLNHKVIIINDDIFNFKTEELFDCIYFDIWNVINREYFKEHLYLIKKYYNNLNKKNLMSWIGSWRFSDFKK